jgi:hypothetical protein
MRIVVTSVFVEDQEKALSFYTEVLGFQKKTDIPLGEHRWLTVVSPEEPDGVELLLEPSGHPAVKPFKQALVEDGIPFKGSASKMSRPSTPASKVSASNSRSLRPRSAMSRRRCSTTRAGTLSRSPRSSGAVMWS